jgi:GMP synthase-like glutamine amidotransferase
VVLASSPTAPYELWCWGANVLASQFHLEFDEPLVIHKIWTRMTDIGRLDARQSADSRAALEAGGQHNMQMLQV